MIGSTESPLIWEPRTTKAGRSISRLRPWTPRKSASVYTGSQPEAQAPWPAPTSLSFDKSHQPGNCRSMNDMADMMVTFAAWPAVQAAEAGAKSRSGDRKDELLLQGMMRANTPAEASTRSTPRASDGEKGGPNMRFTAGGTPLPAQMYGFAHVDREGTGGPSLQTQMAGTQARPWAAPRAGDWRSGSSQVGAAELRPGGSMLPEQMTETEAGGPEPTGSSATTTKRAGSPTPAHPCWLQGFPAVWLLGAAWATQSASQKPSKSSKQ